MSVVSEAEKWVGKVTYIYGSEDVENGTSDCSGFTQYVFKKNGINLPRVADDQSRIGKEVSRSELQAGDLVFFQGTYNTAGASHVGIYIGNNKFIDCGSTGVRVSDLNNSYWSEHYYKATRVDGSTSNNSSLAFGGSSSNSGSISGTAISGIATFFLVLLVAILAMFFLSQAFEIPINPFK